MGQVCEDAYPEDIVCDPPDFPVSNPPTAVLHADRTMLHVGDTITLTGEVNAAPLAGFYKQSYYLHFEDTPSYDLAEHRWDVEKHGIKYSANLTDLFDLASIDSAAMPMLYTDSSLIATFRAVKPGSTSVKLRVRGDVCKHIALGADGRSFFDYGALGCKWNDFSIGSQPLTLTVEP